MCDDALDGHPDVHDLVAEVVAADRPLEDGLPALLVDLGVDEPGAVVLEAEGRLDLPVVDRRLSEGHAHPKLDLDRFHERVRPRKKMEIHCGIVFSILGGLLLPHCP